MSSKGREIRQVADVYDRFAREGVTTHAAPAGAGPFRPVSMARQFGRRDPWDDQVEMKKQLIEEHGVDTPFGQIAMSDRDLQAIQKKKQVLEEAAFDGWFGQHFNVQDLPTRILGEELNPDYFRKREEEILRKAELVTRLKLMDLYGPRDEEDLMIKFGIEHGYIQLDEDWDDFRTVTPYNADKNRVRLEEKVSTVSRFMKDRDAGPLNYKDRNPADPVFASAAAPTDANAPQLADFFAFLRN